MMRAPGITRLHAGSFVFAVFGTLVTTTVMSSLLPLLLSEGLGVPTRDHGATTGQLVLYNSILLPLGAIAGSLSDRVGRRAVYVLGFAMLGSGVALMGQAETLPELVAWRLWSGAGGALAGGMMGALLGDYILEGSRGRFMGMLSMVSGLGAVVGAVALPLLPAALAGDVPAMSGPAMRWTFAGIGAFGVVCAAALSFGLKAGADNPVAAGRGYLDQLRHGLAAARHNEVAFAYVLGFVSRCALIAATAFLPVWVTRLADQAGLSTTDAAAEVGRAFGAAQGTAWLAAPLVGIVFDRLGVSRALRAMLATIALCFLGMGLCEGASGRLPVWSLAVLGLGQIVAIIGSEMYVARVAPADLRGAVVGVYNTFGGLGYLFVATVGGPLMDSWASSAPYLLAGGAAAVACVVALVVRFTPPIDSQFPGVADGG